MRFCQNCGTNNPDDAKFCRRCGSLLVQPIRQNSAPRYANRQPAPQNRRNTAQYRQPQNSRKKRQIERQKESSNSGLVVVMSLLGALLAVLIIGAAILIAIHMAG